MKARLTRAGHRPEAGDGPVGLRPPVDREPGRRRACSGAVLCSLVILLFLGEWRMTAIAVMTLPLSVLAASIGLYATGQHDQRDDAGRPVAGDRPAGRQRDHLPGEHPPPPGPGRHARARRPSWGPARWPCPSWSRPSARFLVLAPLALMPGLGEFLFRPMALAVAFAMISAYLLSRTFVPACCAAWLQRPRAHGHGARPRRRPTTSRRPTSNGRRPAAGAGCSRGRSPAGRRLDRRGHSPATSRLLDVVLRHRLADGRASAFGLLAATLVVLWPVAPPRVLPRGRRRRLRDVRPGRRAAPGSRRPRSGSPQVEEFVRKTIAERRPASCIISELGVTADWSAAYTPNAGPMDAVVKVQLTPSAQPLGPGVRRTCSATGSPSDPRFADLEFAFDAGGMIRAAHERGQVDADQHPRHRQEPGDGPRRSPTAIRERGRRDRRRGRRPDHPAARLPRVRHRRRPRQGRRPRPDPGRRDEERRRRAQLEHPVQQEELLDRPGQQATSTSSASSTPRRTSSRSRPCSNIPITGPTQERADPAAEPRHARAGRPCRPRSPTPTSSRRST